jgi:signal peptidase I
MRAPRRTIISLLGILLAGFVWLFFAPSVLGGSTSYVITHGVSMTPSFHTGDLAILRPETSYQKGDIIAYHSRTLHGVILHRVVDSDATGFVTKGDHNTWRDPDRPSGSDISGRLWIHVPKVGLLFLAARDHLGIVAGIVVLILVAAGGGATRSARRKGRRKGARPVRAPTRRQLSPLLPWAGGLLAVGIAAGLIALTRPPAPAPGPAYTQSTSLSYRAAGDKTVYDKGRLTTGDPVYVALNPQIDVDVSYSVTGTGLRKTHGSLGLVARLSNSSGWQRSVQVAAPRPFTGNDAAVTARVDVSSLRSLLRNVQRRTGSEEGSYTLSLVPAVAAETTLGGKTTSLTSSSEVSFQVRPDEISLVAPPSHQRGTPMIVTTPTASSARGSGPTELKIFGHRVQENLILGSSALLTLLGAALGIVGWLRPPRDPLARLSQPVIAASPDVLDHPALSVATLDALLDLAERYDRPLLHVSEGGRSTYLTEEQGTWYRYADRALAVPLRPEPESIDAFPSYPARPARRPAVVVEPSDSRPIGEIESAIESVRSAIESALDGLDLPAGDADLADAGFAGTDLADTDLPAVIFEADTDPVEAHTGSVSPPATDPDPQAPEPGHSRPVITFVQGDITDQDVDAVVNAANTFLMGGGGVDGAIHAAGGPTILDECRALRAERYEHGLPTGDAVATTAGDLAANWVIHTVGPVYRGADDAERSALLAACHRNALRVADELGARSIAFPAISTGVYGWPLEDAARIAVTAVLGADTRVAEIRFVLHDTAAYEAFSAIPPRA